LICGRCGGELVDAGSEEGFDWYICYTCEDVTTEYNPVYNYDIELRQTPGSKPHRPKKARKWFNP
jgi:hypothetical protein